jgi:hypothetical protein
MALNIHHAILLFLAGALGGELSAVAGGEKASFSLYEPIERFA